MAPAYAAIAGWLLFVALVLSLGGVAARWLLLPRIPPLDPVRDEALAAAAARLGLAGALLTPPALALVFIRQLVEFRDPFVPWTEDAQLLLFNTSWGTTWLWALGASAVAAAGFALGARGRRAGWWVATPAALGLGIFPALTGHASGTGDLRWLTVSADAMHVWAAGAWLGGLAFVLHAERAARRAGRGNASTLPVLVPLFSPVAIVCVATLILTGTLAAWIHLPGLGALVSAPYGRLLGLKLILALAVFALGATNWRRLTPGLAFPAGERALRRVATIELWAAQAVLLVTAALVRTAP